MTASFIQLANALSLAALLFVVASGFTLIFGLLRVVNLAHGALYLLGGYIGLTVARSTGSFALGILAATLSVAVAGYLLDRFLLERVLRNLVDNALKFIDFVTNGENTAYFSQNVGYMPVRKSATSELSMKAFLDANPNSRTAVDQLSRTRSQDYARVFVPGGDQIIGTGLEQIALQKADVASTFAGVATQLQQIIDRQITPKLPK